MEEAGKTPKEIQLEASRLAIDKLLDERRFDDVPEMFPEISIVERAEDRAGEDCAVYLFGKGKWHPDEIQKVIDTSTEEQEMRAGDILLYFDQENNFKHVGKAAEDGRVTSKWGIAHVYQHPSRLLPTYLGEPKIYRQLNPERQ